MHKAISQLIQSFEAAQNRERAKQMERYMRDNFFFYGIMASERKNKIKQFKLALPQEIPYMEKTNIIKGMWEHPKREMQLGAVDWMLTWKQKEYTAEMIDLLEYLIITKSWWDSVDSIASNLVGRYAAKFPKEFHDKALTWRKSPNFWLNRSCLIYQLKYRENTNLEWLSSCILEFKTNKEFFIQKAIGWSLREVSKLNPDWVKKEVDRQQLQGLAKREALRLLK